MHETRSAGGRGQWMLDAFRNFSDGIRHEGPERSFSALEDKIEIMWAGVRPAESRSRTWREWSDESDGERQDRDIAMLVVAFMFFTSLWPANRQRQSSVARQLPPTARVN
jgi:hypothetical protein